MAKLIWIDDEVDLLKPHIVFLENKGYTVTPVNNVNEALEMIEKENFLTARKYFKLSEALSSFPSETKVFARSKIFTKRCSAKADVL